MKKTFIVLMICLVISACKNTEKEVEIQEVETQEIAYASFGEKITDANTKSTEMMTEAFNNMTEGDTIALKMSAKVDEVCQAKGCWMKLNLDNGEQVMVKFKDYGFFMPKDIKGKEVIVNGIAYVHEVPVEEQRHYAEDGGATTDEIAAITQPKKTYSFEADGVLIKE